MAMVISLVLVIEISCALHSSQKKRELKQSSSENPTQIYFYLVDTTTNATLFRLRRGEEIENFFLKGQPVSVRVDVLCDSVSAMRLIVNDGAIVRYTTIRPFSFGGTMSNSIFLPLRTLQVYGEHSLAAIPIDENGNEGEKETISISVVRNIPRRDLFMDSPERLLFNDHVFRGLVPSKHGASKSWTRLRPLQRRVRLHSLQLKHLRPRRRPHSVSME